MSEQKDYLSYGEDTGNIHISEEVLAAIAAGAALDVTGVSGLANQSNGDIGEYLSKRGAMKSVRVLMQEDQSVMVNMSVIVNHGTVIPEIGRKIQESVKQAIESMTGLSVTAVNLTVGGVVFVPATH